MTIAQATAMISKEETRKSKPPKHPPLKRLFDTLCFIHRLTPQQFADLGPDRVITLIRQRDAKMMIPPRADVLKSIQAYPAHYAELKGR